MATTRPARARQPRLPKVTPRLIRRMVRRLVRQFDPDQIILFGSHARGTAGPDSDVDLLVVMPVERKDKPALEVAMGVALHDIRVPLDIIVTSPEDLAWRRRYPGTLERPATLEGKVLYARYRPKAAGPGARMGGQG
jgi:predicted nucleotidyltransferase